MSKKWYSYFVVTDDPVAAQERSPGAPAAPPPKRVSEVVPDAEVETPLSTPATSAVDLAAVYEAARISSPAHGYTVLKVADMLQSEHIQALPADVKRKSVMVALDAAGVKVAEIVEDAVRRDRALDTYERVLAKSLDDLRAQLAAENEWLEAEIAQRVAELRTRIDENNKKMKAEENDFLAWQARKHQEEDAIAAAVGYFVSESPITTRKPAK